MLRRRLVEDFNSVGAITHFVALHLDASYTGWGLSVSVRVALLRRSMSMANRIFGVII
jgi:hypothetical protein